MFTQAYRDAAFLDVKNDDDLIDQQIEFLKFYRENGKNGRWVRLYEDENGYLYAADTVGQAVIIIRDEWITERSPLIRD